MHSTANRDSRLLFWARVREFAVPPSMIESATARRAMGDWAGSCAVARLDVDLNLRAVGRARGREFVALVRADLRRLAPDLLRWHFPRIAPNGLLRPGITISLTRYCADGIGAVHLVARTPPAWADGGQRISLALWDPPEPRSRAHPHPHPDRRFRLDLHRHLWDASRAGELAERSGGVRRWVAEAALLLRADGRADGVVTVRLGTRRLLALDPGIPRITAAQAKNHAWPVLPDAATWVPPDLELLREGLIDADRLHPLVASALVPGHRPLAAARSPGGARHARVVECRGAEHRIGLVDGVLVPLDHDSGEIRRERLLVALGGTALPCLRAIDEAYRHPESLVDFTARLDHGDTAGAVAAVEGLLGPDVLLRSDALRDELDTARRRRVTHGLFRAGLAGVNLVPSTRDERRRAVRAHPRHAISR